MKSCTVFLLTLVSIYALFAPNTYADTIHLKNGDIISGQLVTLDSGLCVFNTKYGSIITIQTLEIMQISTNDEYEVAFASGERIKGQLTQNTADKTLLVSKTFGEIEINTANIVSLVKIFPQREQHSIGQDQQQSFGEEDEKEPPLDFLTGFTVLLAPRTL